MNRTILPRELRIGMAVKWLGVFFEVTSFVHQDGYTLVRARDAVLRASIEFEIDRTTELVVRDRPVPAR